MQAANVLMTALALGLTLGLILGVASDFVVRQVSLLAMSMDDVSIIQPNLEIADVMFASRKRKVVRQGKHSPSQNELLLQQSQYLLRFNG